MKCPNDGSEMEAGMLAIHGQYWSNNQKWWMLPLGTKPLKVIAWRCPKCGKVELQVKQDEK